MKLVAVAVPAGPGSCERARVELAEGCDFRAQSSSSDVLVLTLTEPLPKGTRMRNNDVNPANSSARTGNEDRFR